MKIEIIQGYDQVQSRVVPMKDGTKREMFHQSAYMHQGGAFPVMFNVPIDSPNDAYPVGEYRISASSYKLNNYNNLELDKYNLVLESVQSIKSVKSA